MPDQAFERNSEPTGHNNPAKKALEKRAMEIFEGLYDADPSVQKALLDREAGQDGPLRKEVEELLYSMQNADQISFLQQSLAEKFQGASLVGQQVGSYEVKNVIAAGGMGVVYEARHCHLNRKVALKVPHEGQGNRKELFQRLQREGRALAKLRHPHVVEVFDAGITDDEIPYIAMAFVEGQPLTAVIKGGNYSSQHIIEWMRQIAEALDYLHEAQIYHRDVKPSNIMIDRENRAILMDFGVAHIGDLTRITMVNPGTYFYMCPEQRDGKPTNGLCDLYSLGLVMYELATGEISSAPELSLLPKKTRDERLIASVVKRCIHRNPKVRFQSGQEIVDALRPMETDAPRNRVAIFSILALILIAATFLLFRPFAGTPEPITASAEQETRAVTRAATQTPATIQDLINRSVDLSTLTARLVDLRQRGDLTFGTQSNFPNPDRCYVFVFEEENEPVRAVLAPGSRSRIDLLKDTTISDVQAFLQDKAAVWVTLVD